MNFGRPVITGLGTVNALGVGAGELAAALERGAGPPLSEVDRSAGHHREGCSTTAAMVPAVDLKPWIPPMVARRMSRPSRYAVIAARTALEQARIAIPDERDPSLAVALSSVFGPISFTQRMMDQALDEGPEVMSPFLFTECVANAPAAHIAIEARAAGPNHTLCQREAGPLLAVGRGASDVRSGRVRQALVGAVEEVTPLLHAMLDRFGALARPRSGVEVARPFDWRRNGIVMAEGATVLALEERETARSRGAEIKLELAGWGSAFDPTAGRAGWGHGEDLLARRIEHSLSGWGLAVGEIDRIVSGASGSVAGDRLEARVLRRLWQDRPLPPVLAPKSVTGEYAGIFLGAATLAAAGAPVGPTAGFGEADPDLGLVPHDGSPLEAPRTTLVTSFGSGGAAAWIILVRP